MTIKKKILIHNSKTKLTLTLISSLIFVVLGVISIYDPTALISPLFRSKELIVVVGIAGVLFFGLGSFYLIKKLLDN